MTQEERLAWLIERQSGIGSSDAAGIVGLGFLSPRDVFLSKIQPPDARTPTRGVLARGIVHEPIVAAMYAEDMGVELQPAQSMVRHPLRPWQFANDDRITSEGRHVECKSTAGFDERWGAPMTAEVPDYYFIQCQHQMGCTGAETHDLAALDVIAWELRVYRIAFKPEFFAWMTEVQERFWHDHVVPRNAPGPEWSERFSDEAIARMEPGTTVELGEFVEKLVMQRTQIKLIGDEAKAQVDRINAQIEQAMGTAETAFAGPWRIKRVTVKAGEVPAFWRERYTRLDIRLKPTGRKRKARAIEPVEADPPELPPGETQ